MSVGIERRGLCLVLVAPSGGGKTTIMHRLLSDVADTAQSVSVTTRAPRPGEIDGQHYHFRDHDQFDSLVAADGMLEYAVVHGTSYGIPRAPVEATLRRGTDLLFAIDWKGHLTLQRKLPGDVVGVFLVPPSIAELNRRLGDRGESEHSRSKRLAESKVELAHWQDCRYAVVNDDLDVATAQVKAILLAERTAPHRALRAASLARALTSQPDPATQKYDAIRSIDHGGPYPMVDDLSQENAAVVASELKFTDREQADTVGPEWFRLGRREKSGRLDRISRGWCFALCAVDVLPGSTKLHLFKNQNRFPTSPLFGLYYK